MTASATDRARTRSQDAIIREFLKAACKVCLIAPCDPEIHAATLRLREPLPYRIVPVNHGAKMYHDKLDMHKLATVEVFCKCGAAYKTMNVASSRHCPDCAADAQAKSTRRFTAKRKDRAHRKSYGTTVPQRIEYPGV